MTEDQILAGAKFYARATAFRAVHGLIPNWDDEADERYWKKASEATRDHCLDMVRGVAVACEFKERQDAASIRAMAIVAKARGEAQ